jgi:hypothetical protein
MWWNIHARWLLLTSPLRWRSRKLVLVPQTKPHVILFNLTIFGAARSTTAGLPADITIDRSNLLDYAAEEGNDEFIARARKNPDRAWRRIGRHLDGLDQPVKCIIGGTAPPRGLDVRVTRIDEDRIGVHVEKIDPAKAEEMRKQWRS